MSTLGQLFAPKFLPDGKLTAEGERVMAEELGCDSLRYLPVSAVGEALGMKSDQLCQACIDHNYPTPVGRELYQLAINRYEAGNPVDGRLVDEVAAVVRS